MAVTVDVDTLFERVHDDNDGDDHRSVVGLLWCASRKSMVKAIREETSLIQSYEDSPTLIKVPQ
ncbi:hypothetical protein HUJ05_010855 [Dendroctonus ponderosae]|nr:hypothetical protein HUJ05_010855 [Dendroctonus ponderosae]